MRVKTTNWKIRHFVRATSIVYIGCYQKCVQAIVYQFDSIIVTCTVGYMYPIIYETRGIFLLLLFIRITNCPITKSRFPSLRL